MRNYELYGRGFNFVNKFNGIKTRKVMEPVSIAVYDICTTFLFL